MSLFELTHPNQDSLGFPESLTEKYKPETIADFIGLEKQKKILENLAANPKSINFLFSGPSGTGKTTIALALARAIPAEVHHIPSQACNLETINRVRATCQYVPISGFRFHLVLMDELDQASVPAQNSLLSKLDSTDKAPDTIWIGTANGTDRLEQRLLSRFHVLEFSSYGISQDCTKLLQEVWNKETNNNPKVPNFARIVKDSTNNVREALNRLEMEVMGV